MCKIKIIASLDFETIFSISHQLWNKNLIFPLYLLWCTTAGMEVIFVLLQVCVAQWSEGQPLNPRLVVLEGEVDVNLTRPTLNYPLGHALHPHPGLWWVPTIVYTGGILQLARKHYSIITLLIMCRKLELQRNLWFDMSFRTISISSHLTFYSNFRLKQSMLLEILLLKKLLQYYSVIQVNSVKYFI